MYRALGMATTCNPEAFHSWYWQEPLRSSVLFGNLDSAKALDHHLFDKYKLRGVGPLTSTHPVRRDRTNQTFLQSASAPPSPKTKPDPLWRIRFCVLFFVLLGYPIFLSPTQTTCPLSVSKVERKPVGRKVIVHLMSL